MVSSFRQVRHIPVDPSVLRRTLALCALSGAAALVYEVSWTKQLTLLLGSTGKAHAAALGGFLAALAAGSWALGRAGERAQSPLLFYAKVEALVAAAGLLAPLAARLAPDALRLPAFGLLAAAGAFMMGGALPALARARGGFSSLYAVNCLAAAFGALLADFLLIPALGLMGAAHAAAGLNLVAALVAWKSAWRVVSGGASASAQPLRVPVEAPRPDGPPRDPERLPVEALWLAGFCSGYVALLCETAWIRLLALVIGSSVYSFSVMLAAIIAGLSLGAALAPRLRRRLGSRALGVAYLGFAAALLLSLAYGQQGLYQFRWLYARMAGAELPYGLYEAAKLGFCLAAFVPLSSVMGLSLPLVSLELGREGSASETGRLLALNTVGCVAGAFVALWLLPRLGLEGLLRSAAMIGFALGAGLLAAAVPGAASRRAGLALALLGAGVAATALVPRWDNLLFCLAGFRMRLEGASYKTYCEVVNKTYTLLYHRDGAESTVTAIRGADGLLSLQVNAKADASTGSDMRTQILLGALPLLLKPGAADALVIGWGSGITVGAALGPGLERLDAVELAREVVQASWHFNEHNGRPLSDPRVAVHVEDAKTFVRRARARYDVIVSEPSNPWMAGVGSLFSHEFYQDARRRLKPGGVMAQWMHLYEMDDETLRLILRTFVASFPEASLWGINGTDVLLVGSEAPLEHDWRRMQAHFEQPAVKGWFEKAGVRSVPAALAMEILSNRTLREAIGEGPLNTDERPRLEYAAPRAQYRQDFALLPFERDDRLSSSGRVRLVLARTLERRAKGLSSREFSDIIWALRSRRERPASKVFFEGWIAVDPRGAKAELKRMLAELEARK